MSVKAMAALAAAILLCTGAAASAATKKTTVYRSSPRGQAVVPGRGSAFDPNSPAATGGGSLGYNQTLYNW